MENSPSNKVLKIKTIFGGKHVNFAPDVLHQSVLIRPVALTGQKKFTTPDPRPTLEDEIAVGWHPLPPRGKSLYDAFAWNSMIIRNSPAERGKRQGVRP